MKVATDTANHGQPRKPANKENNPISQIAAAPPTKKYFSKRIIEGCISECNKWP